MYCDALKEVVESLEKPLSYHDNNVIGTYHPLLAMAKCGVKMLVFSSSATVYWQTAVLDFDRATPAIGNQSVWRHQIDYRGVLCDLHLPAPPGASASCAVSIRWGA
nr:NAD-dependent epimerase/dehydratase family protein [Dechloromonas agitata]